MGYRVAMNFRTESGNWVDFALIERVGSDLAEHRPAVHARGGPEFMMRLDVEAGSENLALEDACARVRAAFGDLGEPLVLLSSTIEQV